MHLKCREVTLDADWELPGISQSRQDLESEVERKILMEFGGFSSKPKQSQATSTSDLSPDEPPLEPPLVLPSTPSEPRTPRRRHPKATQHVPEPTSPRIQCFRCQKWGHVSYSCRKCAGCTNQGLCCANCGGDQQATRRLLLGATYIPSTRPKTQDRAPALLMLVHKEVPP